MKVLCTTLAQLPAAASLEGHAFTYFEGTKLDSVGTIGKGLPARLKRKGFAPSLSAWDFLLFSFAVCAADNACVRKDSADGWTRQIELTVSLNQPEVWTRHTRLIQDMLRVLTGDYWTLSFIGDGPKAPAGQRQPCDRDCVALLSGGLDSLIGGINLTAVGRRPIFVSQLAYEDSERQRKYAASMQSSEWHQQFSPSIVFDGPHEPSTRGRSMAFYGLAVLSATLLDAQVVDLVVPENGFISLNPPLVPGRISSLSTRTTHPRFMAMLQQLLTHLGIGIELQMPYRFRSKGQMLAECLGQDALKQFASDSTSCGRFRTNKRMHCGRCVPCMVRKASFLHWGPGKDHTVYRYPSLVGSDKSGSPDDPAAVASAVLLANHKGVDVFLSASLSFAAPEEREEYRSVVKQGLRELEALLMRDGVL